MTYAAILVHVQTDAPGVARLACARALASRFDATLIGLAAEMVPPLTFDDGYVSADVTWYQAMSKLVEEGQVAAKALFDKQAAGLKQPPIWRSGIEPPAPALTRMARGADLLVASPPIKGGTSAYRDATASELAIGSGRPVVVAPDGATPLTGKKVVLAWKDTREARRAFSDALPFLIAADAVLVLEVCEKDEARDAEDHVADVARLLTSHGARPETRVAHGAHAGDVILAEAKAFGADLIVAGAYGHSRLGEFVFGGVTRALLGQAEVYVLLSH